MTKELEKLCLTSEFLNTAIMFLETSLDFKCFENSLKWSIKWCLFLEVFARKASYWELGIHILTLSCITQSFHNDFGAKQMTISFFFSSSFWIIVCFVSFKQENLLAQQPRNSLHLFQINLWPSKQGSNLQVILLLQG